MTSYHYGWEMLHLAVNSLTGHQSQRQRLVDAVLGNLIHINPENDLPPVMHEEFTSFVEGMGSAKVGNEYAAMKSLDDREVHQAFEKIISFYDTVCRHMKQV